MNHRDSKIIGFYVVDCFLCAKAHRRQVLSFEID